MLTEREQCEYARSAIARMMAGEAIICSGETLDGILNFFPDFSKDVASAWNEKAMGTKDTFVCWMKESARPKNLRFDVPKSKAYAHL